MPERSANFVYLQVQEEKPSSALNQHFNSSFNFNSWHLRFHKISSDQAGPDQDSSTSGTSVLQDIDSFAIRRDPFVQFGSEEAY